MDEGKKEMFYLTMQSTHFWSESVNVVRALFTHDAMGYRIDLSWWTH